MFSENPRLSCQSFSEILIISVNIYTLSSIFRRTAKQKPTKIGEPWAQLSVLLRDSKNLGEDLAWNTSKSKLIIKN
jgi:hypothetical protein